MPEDTDDTLPEANEGDRFRVFELRGMHVMLASDVAEVFGVETREIVQNITRNSAKFSERYAVEITEEEQKNLRSLGVIPKAGRGGSRALPWVISQKGTMRLATIMDAPKAIEATDTFIDVFTEVLTQVYQGKHEIEVSNPSRIAPDEDTTKQAQSVRKQIAKAVTNLLNTVVDTKSKTTVKDELGEVAIGVTTHLKEWLNAKKVGNEKIEAETLLVLEQARDLFERRQSDLQGAALDQERKALDNIEKKIVLVERLMEMHDRLEPNAVVGLVGGFMAPPTALPAPTEASQKRLPKKKDE